MDEGGKKGPRPDKKTPDETWVDRLGFRDKAPQGVAVYRGLVRATPGDDTSYDLYPTLDMRTCLRIRREDVLHLEDLPPERSPFGTLGGSKLLVRAGAPIQSIRTVSSSFEAGSEDEFDLDIRLGATGSGGGGGGNQTIPDTGCGDACGTIPPFSDPDVGGCVSVPQTFCGCTQKCTIDTCGCPPTNDWPSCACPITRTCYTVCPGATCNTCQTNCGTCATQCGTCATNCGTCATHCGTCRANTCATKCGQETCGPCTHIFTRCNQHTCHNP